MKVLVTGTRAPASMDILRSLLKAGYEVYSADSMTFPLGRFVKGIKQHFSLPKPNRDLSAFKETLKNLVIKYKIDLVIPTCEEIFFVSQAYEELSPFTRLFCEPFPRLLSLHNKYVFNQLVQEYGLKAPTSWLLNSEEDKRHITADAAIVLKPIYSRFGAHLIIKPTQKEIDDLPLKVPYIAQKFISGKEYCSYAIADDGKVLVHACYHPKYTTGPAAGIYFEPAHIEAIHQFVTVFCNHYKFNGQIAFDFIVKDNQAYVLECNPRATSGFHMIADHINWNEILNGTSQDFTTPKTPFMLGLGMTLYGTHYFFSNPQEFIRDYKKAHDVLTNKAFPWIRLKSMITTANIVLRMIKEQKSFHEASTDDIEFNG
jgi:predicted ATP-grasp superfamily ATP-dependent carboligase